MPRGLVEIDVDAHHRLERGEHLIHSRAIGARENGVPGDREQRAEQIGHAELLCDLGVLVADQRVFEHGLEEERRGVSDQSIT